MFYFPTFRFKQCQYSIKVKTKRKFNSTFSYLGTSNIMLLTEKKKSFCSAEMGEFVFATKDSFRHIM